MNERTELYKQRLAPDNQGIKSLPFVKNKSILRERLRTISISVTILISISITISVRRMWRKKAREKKWPLECWGRFASRPRFRTTIFFSPFFRVTLDGLRKRGTTRSLHQLSPAIAWIRWCSSQPEPWVSLNCLAAFRDTYKRQIYKWTVLHRTAQTQQEGLEDCCGGSVADETKTNRCTYLFNAIIAAKSCSFSAWLVPKYCHACNKGGHYR